MTGKHQAARAVSMGSWDTLEGVRYVRLCAGLRATGAGNVLRHPAVLLRSCLGAALRSVCCHLDHDVSCVDCEPDLRGGCAYQYLFDTVRPDDAPRLKGVRDIPRPLVLHSPERTREQVRTGDPLQVDLVLVGRAVEFLPHVVVALGRAGALGIDSGRVQYMLERVEQETEQGTRLLFDRNRQQAEPRPESGPPRRYAAGDALEVRFVTPTCLVSAGQAQRRVEFSVLIRALLRRISSLSFFHCGHELQLDFPALVAQAAEVHVESCDTRWVTSSRYSRRQARRIPRYGVEGSVVYRGSRLKEFHPLLALGTVLGVGKNTTSGMGRFEVTAPD